MLPIEMSPVSALALFDTTKDQRKSFVEGVIEQIESGNANPLTVHIFLKNNEEILKALTSDERYKAAVLKEGEKYNKQEYHNAKIACKESGVRYDYSVCDDPELTRLTLEFEIAKAALEERQKMLKNAPASGLSILTEDGEIKKVFPPSKSSQTIVSITLK